MVVCVEGLSAEVYSTISAECPRMFQNKPKIENEVCSGLTVNEYAIVKTSLDELKIELGLHTYYLGVTDFVKVTIC